MRKILSIFTAMLCAVAVSADPVVLPATLDVSNVSFRSEGMPDFVIEEGQDYAGTYFDMGAHDSSNDTLLYAEWDVTIEPIKYNIAVDVYNTNSWRVQLYLLNQAGDTLKDLRYKGHSGEKGQFGIGSMDLSDLVAGTYKLRARAATAWSAMKLKDVIFAADYQGVNVDLPGTLLPAYAELSEGASVANNAIAFNPSTANTEYAKWNVTFAEAGTFDVSIDMTASNGHTYGVALLSATDESQIAAVAEEQAWDTGVKTLGQIAVPAAGSYIVKLTNATQWSEAVLNSITFAAPAPAHTYTVAGSSADLFGTAWDPTNVANDMVLQEDNTYKWEKTDLELAAGTIEFKVCEDHAWTNCWPAQNYQLSITESGIYTIDIYFNPADNNYVGAQATKTGDAVVIPTVAMHGNFLGSWADTENFAVAEGDETASLTLTLAEGNYEFGMRIGGSGNWTANGVAFTRENNAAEVVAGQGNLTLAADVAGEYTFTWTYATNNLAITFPEVEPIVVDDWAKILFAEAVSADELAEDATFSLLGNEFAISITDPDNKISIDANDARFGTADEYEMYHFRMKSGGKSSASKNFLTANVAEYGILRIAVRTGTNSATDRNLVVVQGEDTLYNEVVVESAAIEVVEGEGEAAQTVKVYPFIDVLVAAGDVRISYPVGSLNFYAFAFKPQETPQPTDAPAAAPEEPAYAPYQVHAAYSPKYNADCNFGEWGSGTQYTQEAYGKKYVTNNMGYFGLEFTGMDCSEMEALHLDVWSASDISFRVVPIHGGPEVGVMVNAQGMQWNAIDIALSEFEGVTDWSNVYQIKIDNAAEMTFWLNNVYFYTTQEKTVDLTDGYYLIGNMNSWDIHNITADHMFAANPDNEAEFVLHYTLADGDKFKVVAVAENAIAAWYPAEAGDYVVDFAHSGEKDIYFRPDYQGGEGWHAGCIYVAADPNANPWETWFASYDTWNTETESYLEWDGENQKATIHINVDKYGQWRAQVKYHGPVAEAGKCYRIALKLKANNAINNVTIKYQDSDQAGAEMVYVQDAALQAGVEYVFDRVAAGTDGGNGIMVLDFGFSHAGDIIEIYDVVIEETECPQPIEEADYYLVGSMTGWQVIPDDQHLFAPNAENDAEYLLYTTLAEGDEFKVVKVQGDAQTWMPDGMGNNYVVDAAHAGKVLIYFRPDGQGGEGWHYGYIFVEIDHTGIDNTAVDAQVMKQIENGQVIIIKNGVKYNIMGARVR